MVKNKKQDGTAEFNTHIDILAELLDAAPGAITVHDLSGKFLYTNQKNLDLHGYEMDEFLNLNLHDLDVPESEDLINERIEKIKKDGEATFIVHHFKKDGSKIPLEIFTKITQWNGKPVLLSIATDIAERIEKEDNIRKSEEKFRNLVTQMQSGLALHEIILDDNGTPIDYRFIDVNPAFERLTGLKKENVIGKTVLEVLPGTEKLWIERYGRVALTGEPVEFENYASQLDRYYRVVAYRPQKNQFAVVVQEVTEKRRAEEKLKDNLALLRIAGEVTKLGGWNVNLEENRSYWSDEVAAIHEMPAGFAPLLEEGINFYAPEWREKITQVFTDCAKKGIPYNERMEIITATGKRIWIKTIGEAVRNEKGEIFKVHGAFQDISEEVEAEKKLKESEERYKALHNASFGGIVIHDKGIIIECNQGFSDITGYSYNKLIGMNGLLLIAEHARDKVIKNINEGYELPYESVGVRKNGEEYPLRLEARNIPFKGKTVRATEFRDITEQKEAEKSIRESENRFRTVSEYSHNAICIIDLSGKIIWANDSLAKIGGYSKEQMYATESFIQFIAPESVEFVVGNFMKFAAGEEYEHHYSFYFIKSNGEKRLCKKHMTDYKDRSGNRFLTISMMDVTDQTKAENELRESEEKFRQLADSTTAGIFIHGGEEFQYINNSTTIHTGFSQEELYKMKFIDLVYPDDRQMVIDVWNRRNKGEQISSSYECRLNKKDGGYIWAEISANLLDFKGKKALIGTAFDITDRKLAQEAREKLQKELAQAQKMESIGRLAGGVAHDFNNMLSVILGRTELALMKTRDDSPIFNELVEIQNAAERSAALTKQLLAFARKQVVSPKILDVNENIEKILALVKRLIGENIALKWTPGKKVWNIMMDPTQLDQIFTNLCVNSKDAMPDGGKIIIRAENATVDGVDENMPGLIPGDFVKISVEDNGHGMDKETASQIFEPFFTTKETGRGTGLGLATVFGIVKQNKGYIYCFSTEGAGTSFEIYLPKKAGKNIEENFEKPICIKGEESITILLVEDEQTILEMGRSMLQIFGYTVISAKSPQEAIKISLEHKGKIDLLITDVVMPEMNGRELSKKIISHHPEIKCLFMSGYTAEVIAYQGVLDEDMNFIQKPFTMKILGEKVKTVMGGKEKHTVAE